VPTEIYKDIPREGDEGTRIGCLVKSVDKGETITAKTVTALQYAGDTFYWAELSGQPVTCAKP